MGSSVQGRFGIVVLATAYNAQPSFAACQAVLIEIESGPEPWVSPAEIDVAKSHPSQMGKVGDTGVGRNNRRVEGDGTDDHDEVPHPDRKEEIKIYGPVGIDEPVGE